MSEDWDKPTVLRKGQTSVKTSRTAAAVNKAMATSGNVETYKKMTAGGNKQHSGPAVNLAKLEDDAEGLKVSTINKDVARAIIDGRQAKAMTQKELATKINEKVQVIQEFEGGAALPNQSILGKLERALGVKLRGTNIGSPLTFGKQ